MNKGTDKKAARPPKPLASFIERHNHNRVQDELFRVHVQPYLRKLKSDGTFLPPPKKDGKKGRARSAAMLMRGISKGPAAEAMAERAAFPHAPHHTLRPATVRALAHKGEQPSPWAEEERVGKAITEFLFAPDLMLLFAENWWGGELKKKEKWRKVSRTKKRGKGTGRPYVETEHVGALAPCPVCKSNEFVVVKGVSFGNTRESERDQAPHSLLPKSTTLARPGSSAWTA